MFPLPEEDRTLSPLTGWTRRHWEAVADGLLAAVEPYRSADGAEIRLPGRASWTECDGMEGFARTFLIAAFRVAGGGPQKLLAPYKPGFVAGPGVWPGVVEKHQPMVEAASLALGLWLTREHLWDALSEDEQERLAAYLTTAFDREPVDNNWWLFPVTVGGFLASVGRHEKASQEAIERGLARIEAWYVGDGWYTDGERRSFDHYNGWAMHLYPVLYGLLSGTAMPEHRARLREFLGSFSLMFGAQGETLYMGRSVTYRFASVASLMLGAVTGDTPLSPGATRRLGSGAVKYFLEHGALSPEGLLTLGWYGPHEPSLQDYSGSGSPYWAAKAFVGLLAPADHPLWTDVEEAAPEGVLPVPGAGLIVHNTGGIARVVNHGSQHHAGDPLYDRYAYSTHTAPTTAVPDNHVGLLQDDGTVTPRGTITPCGAGFIGEVAWAASSSSSGLKSLSLVRGAVEVRVHRAPPGSAVRQSGWAVTGDELTSVLLPLYGFAEAKAELVEDGTAFGAPALVPTLTGTSPTGWVVSAAALTTRDAIYGEPPEANVSDHIVLTWPDGIRIAFQWDSNFPEFSTQ